MATFRWVGGRNRSPWRGFWQPTLTVHDPNPPLNLESPAAGGEVTGTGVLVSGNSVAIGACLSAALGSGALVAPTPTLAGVGIGSSVGSGVLADSAATITGAGTSTALGTGALTDQVS